eukprot:GHVR01164502.1.p1 GENE.GHVR01164502.1~~GHVR01164502.1.p1  ORF type:complete len:414 (+),score=90.48 GHVR01164502.1:101-1342(+)
MQPLQHPFSSTTGNINTNTGNPRRPSLGYPYSLPPSTQHRNFNQETATPPPQEPHNLLHSAPTDNTSTIPQHSYNTDTNININNINNINNNHIWASPFKQSLPPQSTTTSTNYESYQHNTQPHHTSGPQSAWTGGEAPVDGGVLDHMGRQIIGQQVAGAHKTIHASVDKFIFTLRRYFNVSHESVIKKLLHFHFPFLSLSLFNRRRHTNKSLSGSSVGLSDDHYESQDKPNLIQPDLYLPLMAFITYVLQVGLLRGTIGDFHPEVLGATATKGAIVFALEVLLARVVLFVAGGDICTIDLACELGCVFVAAVDVVSLGLLCVRSFAYWIIFIYFAFCASIYVMKSMFSIPGVSPPQGNDLGMTHVQGKYRKLSVLVYALALLQPVCVYVLTPRYSNMMDIQIDSLMKIRAEKS